MWEVGRRRAVREIRDAAGVGWVVFLIARGSQAAARDHSLPEEFRDGWLVFESETGEKRRLGPPPENWESLTDGQLEVLRSRATPHLARRRPQHESGATNAPAPETRAAGALGPQLRQMEAQLSTALGAVCEMPPPSKLNTGELIRVEETLALATEAAKEAVSLRRKLRADRERKVQSVDDLSAPDDRHA
jgi:hypothetical protein